MTIASFSPPVGPSVGGTSRSVTPRVRRNQYGDGYSQRTPDGINTFPRKATLRWNMLSYADAQAIEDFFVGLGGSAPFSYTLPGESTARKWTVVSWERSELDGQLQQVTAQLVEEFDP